MGYDKDFLITDDKFVVENLNTFDEIRKTVSMESDRVYGKAV